MTPPDSSHSLRLAVTGFVEEKAGSVASANALLLQQLLAFGLEIDFFSKSSFVDPRPAVGQHPGFRFVETDNVGADRLRRRLQRYPGLGFVGSMIDSRSYEKLVLKRISQEHQQRQYDLVLWLGTWATGRVAGLPNVSFAQGSPGTDARSVLNRAREIEILAGKSVRWRWQVLSRLRLSKLGLPRLDFTDRAIIGSEISRDTLIGLYRMPADSVAVLPYPIDLQLFVPMSDKPAPSPPLRILWLGRIIPRKRLDIFLNGTAEAIRNGCDVRCTIVGDLGFIPGYDGLIDSFPYPDRLEWRRNVPRSEVPALLHQHDVLAQPSEEENFGSSVAEAQACGLPVVVGLTNGNADYLCSRDIHLQHESSACFAEAIAELADRRENGRWGNAAQSRAVAEQSFSLESVAIKLSQILEISRTRRN